MQPNSHKSCARRFNRELATMTPLEFQRWNPRFSIEESQQRVNEAAVFVAALPVNPLQEEVDARILDGSAQITMTDMVARLRAIGYRLDRSMDCKSSPRWMTGPRAGKSYPAVSLRPVQIDDGKAAWHFEARRDDNFKTLQAIRDQIFFVAKGAICEI